MKIRSFSLLFWCLPFLIIVGEALAQSGQSKNELLEDLLSGSDVCVNLGYVSEDAVNIERLEYEKRLVVVNQQLAKALADLETIDNEVSKSNSPSVDDRLDFLRDAVMQCEMKYAALSEEKNSSIENGQSDTELRQQVSELKRQLNSLQTLLSLTEEKAKQDEVQLQNLGNRLNAALARVASEERKRRQEEQKLKLELEAKINELEKLKSATSGSENLGRSITQYKKTIQRLLNEKDCNAGSVDGVIGTKTVKAAERFALASGFKKRSGLVYDEDFFNHLSSSEGKCYGAVVNGYFAGSWNIRSICPNELFFATAKIVEINKAQNKYEVVDYVNNYYQRASGTAEVRGNTLFVDLYFKDLDLNEKVSLRRSGPRLVGATLSGCRIQAIPMGGKFEFTDE